MNSKLGIVTQTLLVAAVAGPAARAQETLFTLTSNAGNFGAPVSGDGDADGDGVPDFIVGSPAADDPTGIQNAGAVQVFSGLDGSLLHILYGEQAGNGFGSAVDFIGDVDGDGRSDFAVGSPGFSPQPPFVLTAGSVYIFSGLTGARLFRVDSPNGKERFGQSVAGVGDVDGDAVPDVAAGMSCSGCSSFKGGAVRVISGSNGSIIRLDFFPGPALLQLGYDVGAAGDANADGTPDVVASAVLGGATVPAAGDVYVYDGGNFSNISMSSGDDPLDAYGASVGPAGDSDGDGFDDVVVGDTGDSNDGGATFPGSATVVRGQNGTTIRKVWGVEDFSLFGQSVDGDFDVDGDDVPDFAVGAPFQDVGAAANKGVLHVFSGASGVELFTLGGDNVDDSFSTDVHGAGDVDGDGREDLIVGSDRTVTTGLYARVVRYACGAVVTYGAGCVGSNGLTPSLGFDGCVAAGEEVVLSIDNGLAGSLAFFFLGTARASIPVAGGCTLLVPPALGLAGPFQLDGAGSFTQQSVLPATSSGAMLTLQAFLTDPALAHRFSTTQGIEVQVD